MARGKTKGAGSFLQVSLKELNRVLKEDAMVVISRRYAEALELKTDNFVASTENVKAKKPVEFKTAKLTEEELAEKTPVNFKEENW